MCVNYRIITLKLFKKKKNVFMKIVKETFLNFFVCIFGG